MIARELAGVAAGVAVATASSVGVTLLVEWPFYVALPIGLVAGFATAAFSIGRVRRTIP